MKPSLPPLPTDITVPKHIAFSPNGNRRWAEEKNLSSMEGHKAGAEVMIRLIEAGKFYGIHTMTFWGFSTENWNRTQDEVGYLMKLFEFLYDNHRTTVIGEDVRVVHLGRKDRLPDSLRKKIAEIEEATKDRDQHVLNLAIDYGGQDEVLRAIKNVIKDVQTGTIQPDQIFETVGWYIQDKVPYYRFKDYLDTGNQPYPYPDIVIRNAGDKRTSGFLPWQSIYAEYIWLDEYFPEMNETHLYDAIMTYAGRERRFGGDAPKNR